MRIARLCGVNAQVKVPGIVAGMAGGADSIDDMDLLRHGGVGPVTGLAPRRFEDWVRAHARVLNGGG